MKIILSFILSLSFFLAYPAQASEESHKEAAKQMVEVSNLDTMLKAMYQQINTLITQSILSKEPCLAPIQEPLIKLISQYDQKILNADVVKGEIQKVYQTEFTEEELKQIVAFYKTDAGKKVLSKGPLLAAKEIDIAQKEIDRNKGQGVMKDLQKDINKLIDGMDTKSLSPECKKKFEEGKLRLQTDEKAKAAETKAGETKPADTKAETKPAVGAGAVAPAATATSNAKTEPKAETKTESKSNTKSKAKHLPLPFALTQVHIFFLSLF